PLLGRCGRPGKPPRQRRSARLGPPPRGGRLPSGRRGGPVAPRRGRGGGQGHRARARQPQPRTARAGRIDMLSGRSNDRIVVFAGPSLPPASRPQSPSLLWLAPARAGDGLRLAADPPAAVVLLDGVFDEAPSIRHKELLVLVGQGVRVIGAAS